jgi:hypothetical protein
LFRVEIAPFNAGGPTARAQDAMRGPKNARARTSGMNPRSTRPQRRKREVVEVVSCCAENAAEPLYAQKPFRRELAEPLRPRLQRARELLTCRYSE